MDTQGHPQLVPRRIRVKARRLRRGRVRLARSRNVGEAREAGASSRPPRVRGVVGKCYYLVSTLTNQPAVGPFFGVRTAS